MKIVFFDLDHTLLDFDKCEKIALFKTIECDLEFFDSIYKEYKKINDDLWREFEKQSSFIKIEELKVLRFKKLIQKFSFEFDEKILAEKYLHFLSEQGYIYDGAIKMLERIQNKYKIYAITNGFYDVQIKRVSEAKISKFFEKLITSEEVGYKKPDIEIFKYALNVAGINNPKDAIMIGDKFEADIIGAKNAGMDVIWYNTKSLELKDKTIKIAKNYEDIIKILEV